MATGADGGAALIRSWSGAPCSVGRARSV